MYIERALDLEKVLSKRSLFLVGPRKTGKSTYIKNQLKKLEVALAWTLLDGRLRLRVLADPGFLRQEIATVWGKSFGRKSQSTAHASI